MLRKDKSVKIRHQNLQVLATKIYKVSYGLPPQIINNVFELKSVPYNMRRQDIFRSRNVYAVGHGTDSLPQVIKNSKSLSVFKTKIELYMKIPNFSPRNLCVQL